jgi:hypothetical protein
MVFRVIRRSGDTVTILVPRGLTHSHLFSFLVLHFALYGTSRYFV